MKIKPLLILCLMGLVFKPATLCAHRPLTAEDAGTLAPLNAELEVGHNFIIPQGTDKTFEGVYTFNAGIIKNLETGFTIPVIYNNHARGVSKNDDGSLTVSKTDTRGVGDLVLLTKYSLVSESKWLPAFTPVGSVTFATGNASKGLGDSENSYHILGAMTKTWHRLLVHLNVGWNFIPETQDRLIARVAADFEITPKWRTVLEWDHATDFQSSEENDVSGLLGGFIFVVNQHLNFDIATRAGLAAEDDNFTLTAGFTYAL